jgi:hypothetical protein
LQPQQQQMMHVSTHPLHWHQQQQQVKRKMMVT